MTDISSVASSLTGAVVPWVVAAVKSHLLPWSGKAAIWLSFGVSVACVSIAYFTGAQDPNLQDWLTNVGLAFSLSQILYQHVQESLSPQGEDNNPQ